MINIDDILFQKFGRLTPLEEVGFYHSPSGRKNRKIRCSCSCGKECVTILNSLVSGKATSCGCKRKESMSMAIKTHGMSGTRIYNIWCGIIDRTNNKNNSMYKNYGGRGIGVCDRWRDFALFYHDMAAGYKDSLSIDRIDNDKGYYLDNCRWATNKEQANNKSDSLRYYGKPLSEWAEIHDIKYNTLYKRIKKLKWHPSFLVAEIPQISSATKSKINNN